MKRPPERRRRPAGALAAPLRALALACMFALGQGCAYYSFTGASIPTHLNTVAVPLVEDVSVSPLTTMDETLTQLFLDRFVQQTRLTLEQNEDQADVVLSARIERYVNEPAAVSGDERAALNRVTVYVAVRYYDRVQEAELLARTFSSFETYDPLAQGLAGEEQAALAALENIADDVFTAATSNW